MRPKIPRNWLDLDSRQIAMTVMIDVSMILLVFFMCATTNATATRESVALPRADNGEPEDAAGRLVLNVLAGNARDSGQDDETYLQGKKLTDAELAEIIREYAQSGIRDERGYVDRLVIIRADRRAKYHSIKRLADLCRENSLWRIAYGAFAVDGADVK